MLFNVNNGQNAILCGGIGQGFKMMNDTWNFNYETEKWSKEAHNNELKNLYVHSWTCHEGATVISAETDVDKGLYQYTNAINKIGLIKIIGTNDIVKTSGKN